MYVGFFFQFCCLVRSEDTHEIKPPHTKNSVEKYFSHHVCGFLDSGVQWTEGVVRVTRLGGGCKSCFQVY